jgi:hypothetical protein
VRGKYGEQQARPTCYGKRMNITLDHVGIVGRSITPLLNWARANGFSPTEPKPLLGAPDKDGNPRDLGQVSAHVVLQRGYIELSAVSDLSLNAHLAPYLRDREGLLILGSRALVHRPSLCSFTPRTSPSPHGSFASHFPYFPLTPALSLREREKNTSPSGRGRERTRTGEGKVREVKNEVRPG